MSAGSAHTCVVLDDGSVSVGVKMSMGSWEMVSGVKQTRCAEGATPVTWRRPHRPPSALDMRTRALFLMTGPSSAGDKILVVNWAIVLDGVGQQLPVWLIWTRSHRPSIAAAFNHTRYPRQRFNEVLGDDTRIVGDGNRFKQETPVLVDLPTVGQPLPWTLPSITPAPFSTTVPRRAGGTTTKDKQALTMVLSLETTSKVSSPTTLVDSPPVGQPLPSPLERRTRFHS